MRTTNAHDNITERTKINAQDTRIRSKNYLPIQQIHRWNFKKILLIWTVRTIRPSQSFCNKDWDVSASDCPRDSQHSSPAPHFERLDSSSIHCTHSPVMMNGPTFFFLWCWLYRGAFYSYNVKTRVAGVVIRVSGNKKNACTYCFGKKPMHVLFTQTLYVVYPTGINHY